MLFRKGSNQVERALHAVAREDFLPPNLQGRARQDKPLPIGFGQTISQPSLVARMTELLSLTERSRVLEVGTGSGFQTALLAEIAAEVFTIERIPALAVEAVTRLRELGYDNITFRIGDGAYGWPEMAPFDGIIVTAAARIVPPALFEQLRIGGRLVAPVGENEGDQMLVVVEKMPGGELHWRNFCPVRFVPLVSDAV
jgi:protein-L-isoaspartate(D-aspartate) O-methyltransferase